MGENYAHLFPTQIRAMALDRVIDPNMEPNDMIYGQVVGFEQNLQAFLSDCRARKAALNPCYYAATGDPGTKLTDLMNQLDTKPMNVGNRQLTRGLALIGVLGVLYDPSSWTYLEKALHLTDRGNGSMLLQLADRYLGRNHDGTYDNMTEANNAVNCLDRPVPIDIVAYDELGASFAKASPLFGPAFQYSNVVYALAGQTSRPGHSTGRFWCTAHPSGRRHR